MKHITHLILSSVLALSLFSGCKKSGGGSCQDVFDHTVSLMPAEMKDQLASSKDDAIAKCEKLSPEARQCALDAKSLEDLMKCPHK
jgi:hypothetical protein